MTSWLLVAVLAAEPGAFVSLGTSDGVTVEAREVPGSTSRELRLRLAVAGHAAPACERAFGHGRIEAWEPGLSKRTVLRETPTERVTWELSEPPLASPREFVVRKRLLVGPDGGCRVEFAGLDGEGPPLGAGHVRVRQLSGSFVITPGPGGTVAIEHRVHTDPGGDVPAWLAEGTRKDASVKWVLALGEAAAGK